MHSIARVSLQVALKNHVSRNERYAVTTGSVTGSSFRVGAYPGGSQDLSSFSGRRSGSNEVPLYSAHLEGAVICPFVRDHDLLLLIAFAEWPEQANANPQLSFQ